MISRSEVIVSDETNGKLYKYSIPNRNPVWILDGLDSPVDITSDSAGLIYVASQNAKKIYVVNSSTGQCIGCQSVSHENVKYQNYSLCL